MLKISQQSDDTMTILSLEGNLSGPWVDELEHCWEHAAAGQNRVRVVLETVAFIDAAGRALLKEMHRQGVELVARGCMTKAIVEQITEKP